MLLFMFLLLPCVLIGYCIYKKEPKVIPVIFIGVLSAILLCAFKTFFLYAHRIVPYSVEQNIIYLLVRQTLVPCVILYGLFILFSKDSFAFKVQSLLPLLLSFYAIYLPYTIVSTAEGLYSGFDAFCKPILYTFMIFQLSQLSKSICKSFKEKKQFMVVLKSLFVIVYLVIPTVIESMMIIDEQVIIIGFTLIFVYFVIPIVIFWKHSQNKEK